MRFLLYSALVLLLFSCARKKRQVLETGSTTFEDGSVIRTEKFLERDSVFMEFREASDNRIFLVKKSDTDEHLRDSTYSAIFYYENGKVMQTKSFVKKVATGNWTEFYQSGKKRSVSKFKNGVLVSVQEWWENGNLNVESNYLEKGEMAHKEFYENGNPAQTLQLDSTGTGKCINFYSNGKVREEGNVLLRTPFGMWKRFDSLGNQKSDTLLGMHMKK